MANVPFDPARDFTVGAISLLAAGKHYRRGDDFDKDSVPAAVLKRLYDVSDIRYRDDPNGGMIPSDPLLARRRERRAERTAARRPTVDEDAIAKQLVETHDKKQLLALAKGVPNIRPTMNKRAIALAYIRHGRGAPWAS